MANDRTCQKSAFRTTLDQTLVPWLDGNFARARAIEGSPIVLHIILTVVAVLFVAAVVVGYLVLVVSDVRRTNGEPLDPDGQRSLDAHEQSDAQRRVNKGARGGGW